MKSIVVFLFAFTAVAVFAQNEFINPEGISKPTGYTHVVVARPGKIVYISGQVANDKSGKVVSSDLKSQATQVFENLKTALAAAGATFDDVVKVNYYVKNLKTDMLPIIREVRNGYINKDHPPASTLVGVTALANDDYLLEVEAVAVVAEKTPAKTK